MTEQSHSAQGNGTLSVAIFSYNRGLYLQNLLVSLTRHMPLVQVTVYDDDSDDPETLDVLAKCDATVVTCRSAQGLRHGNLYRNMQRALDECETDWLLFLQDDTQVVRDLDANTMGNIQRVFADPDIAFLRPQLFKGENATSYFDRTTPDEATRIYRPKLSGKNVQFGLAYCDVVLADATKLKAVDWQFSRQERANQEQARGLFKHMPIMGDPLMFYCPEVPSYRDRKLYLASKLVQRRRGGRVVAYHPMTVQAQADFLARPLTVPPVAEQFLEPTEPDVVRPFVFQDYSRNRWLTALYKVESRLVRIARGIKGIFG